MSHHASLLSETATVPVVHPPVRPPAEPERARRQLTPHRLPRLPLARRRLPLPGLPLPRLPLPRLPLPRLGRVASFWTAATVIALCLWSSGAPALLYPVYAARWHLSPTTITVVFATYPAVLMVMLLFFGAISDRIGRRTSMLAGLLILTLASLSFAFAPSPLWLFVGRALQGLGTGLALTAATAALADNDTRQDPRRVGSITTLANATGLTIGPLLAGALLQYAPLPRQLSFLILLALLLAAFVLVLRMPGADRSRDRAATRGGWRPTPVSVPAGQRGTFITAAAGVATVYAVGALFLSLGAQMVGQILHTGNTLVIGATLSSLSLVIGIASVTLRQLQPRTAIAAGGLSATAGLGLLYLAAQWGNLAIFLAAAVFLGASFGLSLMGGVRLIATRAPEHHRAQVISALYLSAYAAQGIAAVAAGLVATHYGLHRAVDVFVPVAAAFALLATASATLRGRARLTRTTP